MVSGVKGETGAETGGRGQERAPVSSGCGFHSVKVLQPMGTVLGSVLIWMDLFFQLL
jgi:hypothetical protein